ncbi:1-acyl-sn-glycerol-3-phosphate acyltransferase [Oceaniglobus trochenteri]|uniref:1-acyl-sn-glycerol-3-phosphate acyltransferase n=1 Tax=Oceaniglobus trochenteri TaxID=2763260 RepID=UPI001CFF68F6|nr:1-acyl-sn-glycerol-3-phosphate acyltransferase [Oceaniglobus trochenteri]
MFRPVELPLWLLLLILLFAAVTFATHFINPTVRWFFRGRMERAVARLNQRLQVPIQPFKLARRHDTILRLSYDPEVTQAVADHARETGLREDAAFALAQKYAREIVPSFSASAYFGFAIRAARWLSTSLFRVQVQAEREDLLRGIDPDSTIVFVMNHRSNMDYVLVTWLAGNRSALSYAVGEWARVWPLSALIRAMGAFFIRRRSRNALYRRVLARYVQMATAAGVTQAMFPEGRLSLTGAVGTARMGLLSYIVEGQNTGRDVVFVPVALNYDQVLEDRILVRAASQKASERRFRGSIVSNAVFVLQWTLRRITGKARRFGVAAVAFGAPLALSSVPMGPGRIETVAGTLMDRLRGAVPVPPVPLYCLALVQADGPLGEAELVARVADLRARMAASGVMCPQEQGTAPLTLLRLREMITEGPEGISIRPDHAELVAFYANSIAHHLADDPITARDAAT